MLSACRGVPPAHGGSFTSQCTTRKGSISSGTVELMPQLTEVMGRSPDPLISVICMSQKTPCCGSRVTSSVEKNWCPVTVTRTRPGESLHRTFKMDVRPVSQFPLPHVWINHSRFLVFHIKIQLTPVTELSCDTCLK